MQPRKRDRVTPIGLHPFARLLRNQRWRNDRTVVAESLDLAVQPVSGRAGFVADVQLCVAPCQLADHLLNRCRRTVDLTNYRTSPSRPPSAMATACFFFAVSIPTNASLYSFMVRRPCMRLGSVCPGNPRNLYWTKGRTGEAKMGEVATWRENKLFSEPERLTLEYAERITYTNQKVDDAFFARLKQHFTEAQIVELTAAVALENFRSKLNPPLGIEAQGFCVVPQRT
jgi:hypothetical protein